MLMLLAFLKKFTKTSYLTLGLVVSVCVFSGRVLSLLWLFCNFLNLKFIKMTYTEQSYQNYQRMNWLDWRYITKVHYR